jgi:hypothetical protein
VGFGVGRVQSALSQEALCGHHSKTAAGASERRIGRREMRKFSGLVYASEKRVENQLRVPFLANMPLHFEPK